MRGIIKVNTKQIQSADYTDDSDSDDDEINHTTQHRPISKYEPIHRSRRHHPRMRDASATPSNDTTRSSTKTPPMQQYNREDTDDRYTPDAMLDEDKKEDNASRESSISIPPPMDWNKSRSTHRRSINHFPTNINLAIPDEIYCDYYVVKSSDTKVLIRLHGTNRISTICRILCPGSFGRGAFNGATIKNGHSQLNQLKNDKLKRIFYDEFDNDDTQQLPKMCCLIHVNDELVYNNAFEDILDTMKHTKPHTLQFQKPHIRPSRITRFNQTYNLMSKVIRHKILFQKWFEYVILLSIIANTVCLAMMNPLESGSTPMQRTIEKLEYAFFAIFLLEMIFKMIGFGLWGKRYDPYLRKRDENKKKERRKWKQCHAQCSRRWSKCWNKLYTKCAMKGLLGKDRQIQTTRNMIRSKSLPNSRRDYTAMSPIHGSCDASISDLWGSKMDSESSLMIVQKHYIPPSGTDEEGESAADHNHYYEGYFPSGWNILDCVIVVSSFFSLFKLGNMTSIRIIRILRPLRTISRVKSLKVLINTVFSSLSQLSNVLFLMLFLFIILGIVGVQLFSGVLHQTCFNRHETDQYMRTHGIPSTQYKHLTQNDWYNGMNNSAYMIGHIGIQDYCSKLYTSEGCKAGDDAICLDIAPNPQCGLVSFDNIGFAILNEFIIITFDGWSEIMYRMQDAVSIYVWIYFFIVTFICSFFALQLNLAVLVTQYAANNRAMMDNDRKQKQHRKRRSQWDPKKKKKIIKQPTLINSPNNAKRNKPEPQPPNKDTREITKETSPSPHRFDYGAAATQTTDEKIEEEEDYDVFDEEDDDTETEIPQMPGMKCRSSANYVPCESENVPLPTPCLVDSRPSQECEKDIEVELSLLGIQNIDEPSNQEWDIDDDEDDDGALDGAPELAPELKENIRSSSHHTFTKVHHRFTKVRSESTLTELSSVSAFTAPGALQKASSAPSMCGTGSSCDTPTPKSTPPISPPYNMLKVSSYSPAPLSPTSRKKKRRKRSLRKFNTIASIQELRPTDAMGHSLKNSQGHNWQDFQSKTFHASLKSEIRNELRQLSIDSEEFERRPSISSFAEMIPSLSPHGAKRENSVDNSSGSRESSPQRPNTGMRFGIVVNHYKEAERMMKENYKFSKKAITNSIPKRSLFHKDTSNRFVQTVYGICINPWFDSILLVCILTNTVIMALQWPYMSPELSHHFELTNNIFTLIFFAEMVLKMIGLGWNEYFGDNFNKFDCIIVVVSCVDLVISFMLGSTSNLSSLSVFRSLRLLRLLRLFRIMRIFRVVNKIESLRILTATLSRAVADVSYLCFIPFLLVFMFATLGLSLFALDYANIDETQLSARHSFKNIWLSMITVFQVVTGDNWTGIMYSNANVTGNSWSFLFFLAIVIFGDFILMNLFVAVLLTKIGEASAENNDANQWLIDALTEYAKQFYDTELRYQDKLLQLCNIAQELRFQKQLHNLEALWLPHYKQRLFTEQFALIGRSLGIFSTRHTIRCKLYALVHSVCFEWFIAVMIVINCIMLAFETPKMHKENPHVLQAMEIVDAVFVCIYSLEMLFKVIADGFIAKPMFDVRDWMFVNVYSDEIFNQTWTGICQQYIKSHVVLPEELTTECGKILNCTQSHHGYTVIHFMSADKNIKHFRMVFYNADDDTINLDPTPHGTTNHYDKLKTTNDCEMSTETSAFDDMDECDTTSVTEYDCFGRSIPQLRYIYKLTNPLTGEWQYQQYDGQSREAPHSFSAVLHSPQMSNIRQGAYLHDNWNIMDALVVMISIISLLFPNSIGYFRVLRAIRPLRLAIRFESLRVAITSLIYSIPGVISTIGFILLFWVALAILGVNLMCGTFMRCSITDPEILATIITRSDCENAGGKWINPAFTFDDIFKSIQSIFIIALRVNWSEIMWNAVDSVGVDLQPQYNNRLEFSLYFICTILIAGFFSFNLLISVVVDNFQEIKSNQCGGSLFLTRAQREWVHQRLITDRIDVGKDYECPTHYCKFRKYIFDLVQNPKFDGFIMICIVLNTLQMCLEHYRQPELWTLVLMYLNIMFIVIFTVEAILKIIGYGFKQYWHYDHWNKFDFILVCVSLIDLALAFVLKLVLNSSTSGEEYRFGFNVLRILRVGRALRLIKKADTLRMMFLTLYYSLPSLFNVGALIFILMFIYSIIGMNVFGSLQHEDSINEFVNFATFPNSMQTLYRIGTLDSWNTIYESCARSATQAMIAAVFFLSYTIITTLILINVFIAVILENFVQIQQLQARNKKLDCVRAWTITWNKLDINPQCKYLSVEAFLFSMVMTPFPIGVLSPTSIESLQLYNPEYRKRLHSLNERIAQKDICAKDKHILEQKRLKLACQTCLHHAQHQRKLKKKFLKRMKKVKLNVIKTGIGVESEDSTGSIDSSATHIWTVAFSDALQALSAMILSKVKMGPKIQAIITDPETEMPLTDWLEFNCETYLDLYGGLEPMEDSDVCMAPEEEEEQQHKKTLRDLKTPHVFASQYEDFVREQTNEDVT